MSPNLEDVKGLGKKIDTLKEGGIDSVEKLAESTPEDLTSLKGIGAATAKKLIDSAKELLGGATEETKVEEKKEDETSQADAEEEAEIQAKIKQLEEKKKRLTGKKVEEGDFVLIKITAKTQKGKIFRVSSEEDAKKAGIFEEEKAGQGYYTPEFVIIGKPGFLNEGLTETVKEMNYFEKRSVRIPPTKAFGKRDPQKIERIGIAKFRKLNEGKNPELGQDFVKQGPQGNQRGTVIRVTQGKVIVDYNHPLAGQNVDYNLEVINKIEDFGEQIEYFMLSKGIPQNSVKEFKMTFTPNDKTISFDVPKTFMFQNLTMLKFGLAMDLQTHMGNVIETVKFVEVFEKIPMPTAPADSVMQKVEEFNKEQEHDHDHDHDHDHE